MAFTNGDKSTSGRYLFQIQEQLRPILSLYYDRLHDQKIPRSAWLSHIQGFSAWGAGHVDEKTGKFVIFDGLSGNQILLFQALDAFLGMESYLTQEILEQNVPRRQREFCRVLRKHSIREQLEQPPHDDETKEMIEEFEKIVKRLRVSLMARRGERLRVFTDGCIPHSLSYSVPRTDLVL